MLRKLFRTRHIAIIGLLVALFLASPGAFSFAAAPGDVVINEIMQNPAAVADSAGEWFELFNPTNNPIDLNGWTIKDNDIDAHVIDNGGPLVIPAGGFLVFGVNADSNTNGGVTVDYVFPSNFFLGNGADELVLLDTAATEIDRVEWDGGPNFPDPNGAAMALASPALDNNVGANWCTASTPYGAGDFGTPGAANDCAPTVPFALINEMDADQTGTDSAEFVELFDGGLGNVNLTGLALVFYNGSTDVSYAAFDLDGFSTDADGYFVLCGDAANVPNCDLDVTPDTNLIQNGEDAIALYAGDAADFPNGTPVTTTDLLDAIVYDTSDPDDPGLLVLLNPGQPQVDENASGNAVLHASQRCPNGSGGARNTDTYTQALPSPGEVNNCPEPPSLILINEVDADQTGTDSAEFVELFDGGLGNTDLSGLTLVFYNGSDDTAYDAFDLDGFSTDADGYFVLCGDAANVPNCDLDATPDTNLIQNGADAIALYIGDASSFPDGTPVTTTDLLDAIVYGTSDPDDPGLLVLLNPGQPQVDENVSGNAVLHANQRCPNGSGGARNTDTYTQAFPDPGETNLCGIPTLEIWQIQGAAHFSPMASETVRTANNIVTAVGTNGFWIQTPDSRADADEATSNGVFVFTGSAPTVSVGDQVDVIGTVTEFRPGGIDTGNLTITEFDNFGLTVEVDSSGNPLPSPTIIGNGGRVPPSVVINDDGAGNVEDQPPATFDAASDGIDFYESLEGMRVQVNDARVVGPTNNFGEIYVVGDDGANASQFTARGGLYISPTDFNPERIQLDDPLYPGVWPLLSVGARLTSPAVGVVHYGFGNFEVYVTELFTVDLSGEVTPEVTSLIGDAIHLTIATYNVENLGGNATPAEFDARAAQIVHNLGAPDILVLEEMQDNDGPANTGVTDASQTFNALIAAIANAGGPTYAFQQINPLDLADGGQPGGNIRVGFLFNPARVGFDFRPGGDATMPNSVVCNAGVPALALNPGRIDPNNLAFFDSRKPLAGEFTFAGQTFFVIGVHFNSKGGDTPLFGFAQPPILNSEAQRLAQAQAVNDFVDSILACDPNANVVVAGDVNDFPFSAPMAVLKGGVLNNLVDTLPADDQYSFVFDGNSQALDHILVSDHMFNLMAPEYDDVHINAEFGLQVSDHDPGVARFNADLTPPEMTVSVTPEVIWPPNQKFVRATTTVTVTDADPNVTVTLLSVTSDEPDSGINRADRPNDIIILDDFNILLRAERDPKGDGRVYTITYQATDSSGNFTVVSVTVTVPLNLGK